MRIRLNTRGKITHQDGTEEWFSLEFSGSVELEEGEENPVETIVNRIATLDAKQSRLVHMLRQSLSSILSPTPVAPPPPTPGA